MTSVPDPRPQLVELAIPLQVTNTSDDNILNDVSVGADGVARVVWSVQEASNGYNVYAVTFPEPSANRPPDCSKVSLDKTLRWSPNNALVPVTASGPPTPMAAPSPCGSMP